MWDRLTAVRLRRLWRQFPAVLILGARQVGKTTLARQTFPRLPYVDLEEPRSRERFQDDPAFQLARYATTPVILDEAQAVPELFAALRGAIDRQAQKPGRFLLLGSAQPSLIRGVSESLAGRSACSISTRSRPRRLARERRGAPGRRSGCAAGFPVRSAATSATGGRGTSGRTSSATSRSSASGPIPSCSVASSPCWRTHKGGC